MRNNKLSLHDLKLKMEELQKQIDSKEQELNIQIGEWVRKQTNLDSLDEIRQNYQIIKIKNENKSTAQNALTNSSINTHTTALSSADITPNSDSNSV